MNHWLLDVIEDRRRAALKASDKAEVYRELLSTDAELNLDLIRDMADALELASLDLILERFEENEDKEKLLRFAACDAFQLFKTLFTSENPPLEQGKTLLRASCLAVLGDRGTDATRWLRALENTGDWPDLPINSENWSERTWATLIDVWLRLIRKRGWIDRDLVLERVEDLRNSQKKFENVYLNGVSAQSAKAAALELIGLYHLAKAADILAHFITDGVVEGNHQVQQLLDTHFDRAHAACESARLIELEPTTRLLAAASTELVKNSIWTVTRAVNSRVTQFVQTLVSRGRGEKAIFDFLPPQRRTLAERGLLGSSRRAVVVSLPTSSGKTLIAQFRILQALNQFDDQDNEGWVAYLAPTRALVNQVARQLRRDFQPLGVVVERVSPALEVDGVEMELLTETKPDAKFRVLATYPAKNLASQHSVVICFMVLAAFTATATRPVFSTARAPTRAVRLYGCSLRVHVLLILLLSMMPRLLQPFGSYISVTLIGSTVHLVPHDSTASSCCGLGVASRLLGAEVLAK